MEITHIAENPALSLVIVACRLGRRPTAGVRKHCSDHGSFLTAELAGRFVIEGLCCRLHTVYPFTGLNYIQVHFQDSLLGPEEFNQNGEISLKPFPEVISPGPQKYVFCRLIADGAASFQILPRLITFKGLGDSLHIKAVVIQKFLILSGHYSLGHMM